MNLARQRIERLLRAGDGLHEDSVVKRIALREIAECIGDAALVRCHCSLAELNLAAAALRERQHHVVAVAAIVEHHRRQEGEVADDLGRKRQ